MSKISKKTGNNKIFIFLIIFIIIIFILYFVFGSCNKCKKKTTTPIINEWSSTQIQDLKNKARWQRHRLPAPSPRLRRYPIP